VAAPRREDLEAIRSSTDRGILLQTARNHAYFNRAVGFIWAVHEGLEARFYCNLDDDIEFTEGSRDLLEYLDQDDWSLKVFSNKYQGYNQRINPYKIDGNCMFVHWQDVLDYGVPDAYPDEVMSFHIENEYSYRLRLLTGRPTIAENEREFYLHHFRTEPHRQKQRGELFGTRGEYGAGYFWAKKYGVEDFNTYEEGIYARLVDVMARKPDAMRNHLLFDGLGNDWKTIWDSIQAEVKPFDG
jgi:hypothetical protein